MSFVRLAAVLAVLAASPAWAADSPAWSGWSHDLFARATTEKRFVILDLEAVWCHWCHVMAHESFEDADTAAQSFSQLGRGIAAGSAASSTRSCAWA